MSQIVIIKENIAKIDNDFLNTDLSVGFYVNGLCKFAYKFRPTGGRFLSLLCYELEDKFNIRLANVVMSFTPRKKTENPDFKFKLTEDEWKSFQIRHNIDLDNFKEYNEISKEKENYDFYQNTNIESSFSYKFFKLLNEFSKISEKQNKIFKDEQMENKEEVKLFHKNIKELIPLCLSIKTIGLKITEIYNKREKILSLEPIMNLNFQSMAFINNMYHIYKLELKTDDENVD